MSATQLALEASAPALQAVAKPARQRDEGNGPANQHVRVVGSYYALSVRIVGGEDQLHSIPSRVASNDRNKVGCFLARLRQE